MNFSDTTISKLLIHHVGSKLQNEDIRVSKKKVAIANDVVHDNLVQFYLQPFTKTFDLFQFQHPSDLKFNEVYNFAETIFNDVDALPKTSSEIAKHLYEHSVHPKVKAGELHVVYFTNCAIDDKTFDAIGIFKTETKVNFITLNNEENNYNIGFEEGINPADGFDKGCLIFNTNKEEGYKIYIIDNQSKSQEAQYWKNDFLNAKPCSDAYQHTKNYLSICKEFVSTQLTKDFEVTKTEQINLLNKSIAYFKEADSFDEKDFTTSVLEQPEVIQSFKDFKQEYVEKHDLEIEECFDVSAQAVKKQTRIFKSVLKLDKNFHIYIHGNKELIEKGIEDNGRKFYKIYYQEEL